MKIGVFFFPQCFAGAGKTTAAAVLILIPVDAVWSFIHIFIADKRHSAEQCDPVLAPERDFFAVAAGIGDYDVVFVILTVHDICHADSFQVAGASGGAGAFAC